MYNGLLTGKILFTFQLKNTVVLLRCHSAGIWTRIGSQYTWQFYEWYCVNRDLCHSRCRTLKIPTLLKTIGAKQRPTFCSPSPAMVSRLYMRETYSYGTENNVQSILLIIGMRCRLITYLIFSIFSFLQCAVKQFYHIFNHVKWWAILGIFQHLICRMNSHHAS